MKVRVIFTVFIVCFIAFPSCSINKLAMNAVADALTGDGSSDVFTGDPDPKLVGDAIPFAIKMYESLLSANPDHQGLMLTTGSLFIMYANAFVQEPAEMLSRREWEAREAALIRSKQLYLRGYGILYNALEKKFPGFKQATVAKGTIQPLLKKCKKEDVGLLYWAVAGGLSAYSIDVLDYNLSSNIPQWSAMIQRAYELDPNYGTASLDEFFILYYASLPVLLGGNLDKAEEHYKLAVEKTKGNSASAYVSYAQSVCVPAQNYNVYKDCLEKAIAIDPNQNTSTRLVNIITQRKARWLLENAWVYFSFLPIPDDY
ncbi:TRAP transporter TatT component family protein [Treponema sp. R80B11-R83G3]